MIRLTSSVSNGKLNNPELFYEYLARFEGKKIDIAIDKHKEKRSNPQNRYWFGVVLPMIKDYAEHFGESHTVQDWHEYYVVKGYFGSKEMNGDIVAKRSHEATTQEFNEAVVRIQKDWAQRGLIIPDPKQTEFL